MAFIKSLISKVLAANKEGDNTETDHYASLEQLRINHEWIDVRVNKTSQSYQSMVLNIDIEANELLIDQLYPPQDINQLGSGDMVEIHSQSKRNPVSFYTRILAREDKQGEAAWRLELPEEIGINQSRSAFRVYVEQEQDLAIDIFIADQPLYRVNIINLSAEGIKLSFSAQDGQRLENFQTLEDCIIRLPDGFDVDCRIDLRVLYSIRAPVPHFMAGGKVEVKQPQQRIKLQQYLASTQRRQRRREMRSI
ncbi:MAG: c-di-GMP-binding flagellar brake protein YcgR [Oceanicoccus sp.]|jgi:c-di-GMP-binding flagellar brake protein YcgR